MSDIQKRLDELTPESVISTRSGGGNKQLSYLEAWYVIDRMNQIFGSLTWSNEIVRLELLPGGDKPSYMAIVELRVWTDAGTITKQGVGYGSDKSGLNPHEMAMKEAVSDAFKTAAKNLGRSMGLSLYDKTQQYVGEADAKQDAPKQPQPRAEAPKSTPKPKAVPATVFKQQIRTAFAILKDQKRITTDEFIKDFTQGVKVEDMDDATVQVVIKKMNDKFPGII